MEGVHVGWRYEDDEGGDDVGEMDDRYNGWDRGSRSSGGGGNVGEIGEGDKMSGGDEVDNREGWGSGERVDGGSWSSGDDVGENDGERESTWRWSNQEKVSSLIKSHTYVSTPPSPAHFTIAIHHIASGNTITNTNTTPILPKNHLTPYTIKLDACTHADARNLGLGHADETLLRSWIASTICILQVIR